MKLIGEEKPKEMEMISKPTLNIDLNVAPVDIDDEDDERSSSNESRLKTPMQGWTFDLHRAFVRAVDRLGGYHRASPNLVLEMMNVKGLTASHVQSQLQMYGSRNLDVLGRTQSNNSSPTLSQVDLTLRIGDMSHQIQSKSFYEQKPLKPSYLNNNNNDDIAYNWRDTWALDHRMNATPLNTNPIKEKFMKDMEPSSSYVKNGNAEVFDNRATAKGIFMGNLDLKTGSSSEPQPVILPMNLLSTNATSTWNIQNAYYNNISGDTKHIDSHENSLCWEKHRAEIIRKGKFEEVLNIEDLLRRENHGLEINPKRKFTDIFLKGKEPAGEPKKLTKTQGNSSANKVESRGRAKRKIGVHGEPVQWIIALPALDGPLGTKWTGGVKTAKPENGPSRAENSKKTNPGSISTDPASSINVPE